VRTSVVRASGRTLVISPLFFENQQLTYAQVNARANQLAHHLQTLGPETIVALC